MRLGQRNHRRTDIYKTRNGRESNEGDREETFIKKQSGKNKKRKESEQSLVSRKLKESFVSKRCGKQYDVLHICNHWIRQREVHC